MATPAEARMIAEWARLVGQEVEVGWNGALWGSVLAWQRKNSPSGFCDNLTIDITGNAYASTALCEGGQITDLGFSRLAQEQLQQLYSRVDGLKNFEINQAESGLYLVFSEAGLAEATEADKQALLDLANKTFTEISIAPKKIP